MLHLCEEQRFAIHQAYIQTAGEQSVMCAQLNRVQTTCDSRQTE